MRRAFFTNSQSLKTFYPRALSKLSLLSISAILLLGSCSSHNFNRNRLPSSKAVFTTPSDISFNGLVVEERLTLASLSFGNVKTSLWLAEGQSFDGYKVLLIDEFHKHVYLEKAKTFYKLELGAAPIKESKAALDIFPKHLEDLTEEGHRWSKLETKIPGSLRLWYESTSRGNLIPVNEDLILYQDIDEHEYVTDAQLVYLSTDIQKVLNEAFQINASLKDTFDPKTKARIKKIGTVISESISYLVIRTHDGDLSYVQVAIP